MIWRLLQKLVWIVLLACGLAACAQVDPTTRLASISSARANGKVGISQASTSVRLFGRGNAGSNTILATSNGGANPLIAVGSGSLWDHLRGQFQLPPSANRPEVQAQIQWYVRHQDYLNRVVLRAAPYMYYILQQTQQRNLPAELVLLPIMESAYNPFANSNRGASGLWQLIHTTAYGYGVKQDWWYDGRRDIYASTNAALDYLTYLQSYFGGDWLLAMASYDTGEGNVQKAIRRNVKSGKEIDFWDLQLSAETRSYVPRLLALAAIISNPGRYNITLPVISDQPYLQQVDLGAPINLSQAAQLAGMSLNDLKQLNPGYSHTMTGPNGPYKLLLPIDRISTFKENLAMAPGLSNTTWGRYKVQHGDTLASIAKKFHTTIAELADANPLKKKKAPVGAVIMIPTGSQYVKPHVVDDNTPTTMASAAPAPAPAPLISQPVSPPSAAATPPQQQVATASPAANNPMTQNIQQALQPSNKVINVAKNNHKTKHPIVASKGKKITHGSTKKGSVVASNKHAKSKPMVAKRSNPNRLANAGNSSRPKS